jgi:CHAT domain-containing protein
MNSSIVKIGRSGSPPLIACAFLLAASFAPRVTRALPQGAAPAEPLAFEQPVERAIDKGEPRRYAFGMKAGEFTQAVVEQIGVDLVVSIYGQDGALLNRVDRPNGNYGPETASLVAPATGQYWLQIKIHPNAASSGRFRVVLSAPRAGAPSDERRVTAERLAYEAETEREKNNREALLHATDLYERARSIWNGLGDLNEEAISLYGAGVSFRSLGENQTAALAFKRALELMQKADDRRGIAIVSAGAGWSYQYLGDLDKALESFNQSLQYRQGTSDYAGEGLTYYGIGWVRLLRGENLLALESFEKSLQLRQKAGEKRGEAVTRIGLGKIYARLKRYEESRSALEQALRELQDSGGQAEALLQLGWVGIMQKEDADAKARFQAALALSLAAKDAAGEATARFGLAVVARRANEAQAAIDQIRRSVELIETLRVGTVGTADTIESRMEIVESLRKASSDPMAADGDDYGFRTSYFRQAQEYYEVYIDLLMRLHEREPGAGHAAEALHVSERARARSLLDLLARTGVDGPEQKALAQPLKLEEIQRRALDENTVLLEYALGAPEADRSFLWLVTQNKVEAYALPKRSKIEAAAQEVYSLLTVRNFNNGQRRREIAARADARFKVAARELGQMLLGPIADQLGNKRLIIVPQGALQFVPFATLPEPEGGRAKEHQGPADARSAQTRQPQSANLTWRSYTPLIVAHEVVVAPSASTLASIRRQTARRSPAEHSLIVFADPVFSANDDRVRQLAQRRRPAPDPGSAAPPPHAAADPLIIPSLNRLSVTDWEARQIASLTSDSRMLRGFSANLDAAKDPSLGAYRFIHFATHAVINPQNYNLSSIVLSQVDEQGRARNGALTVRDIHHLKLPAELIVLSACRTGLGEDVRGEGLLSLARGFLSSGAARVMVSLWAVEDQATAELMNRFYRRTLGPERLSPAAALRATQEEMWREGRWGAPYYWGGFALQGEWR